jgi:hypothetical protein
MSSKDMECEALSRMESFFTDVFPRARAVGKLAEVVRQGLKTSLACFIGMFYWHVLFGMFYSATAYSAILGQIYDLSEFGRINEILISEGGRGVRWGLKPCLRSCGRTWPDSGRISFMPTSCHDFVDRHRALSIASHPP